MSVATKEAVQMREASQRRGMLVVKRNIAEAQAQGESYATFKVRVRQCVALASGARVGQCARLHALNSKQHRRRSHGH